MINVYSWWYFLCAASSINVLAWCISARALKSRLGTLPSNVYALRKLQLFLASGYVFGCAYRSLLPVFDIPRICLFDTWLSSVIVGRSVATVAELCFAMQWALLLREISYETDSRFGNSASFILVPLIGLAETCCWYSVLTTSNLGHVFEETIWGVSACIVVVSLTLSWAKCTSILKHLITGLCITGIAYIVFIFAIDIPMYWSRWILNEASGYKYLGLIDGLSDIAGRWVVSTRWEDWKTEIVWMSLYFSAAVWLSISLVHLPYAGKFTVSNRKNSELSKAVIS